MPAAAPSGASLPLAAATIANVADSVPTGGKPVSTWDPAAAGSSLAERDEYAAHIQRDINCLSEADRTVRRTAAQRLATRLFSGDASLPRPSPALLQAVLCGPLLAPLLRLLADPTEKCRELAVEIFLAAVQVVPDLDALLPTLLPALVRRVGTSPVAESTEEIRLQIMRMLEGPILTRAAPRSLDEFCPDLTKVLCRGLEDPYPEVKKLSCTALSALAGRCSPKALEKEVEALSRSALATSSHQHSRVRSGAVAALGSLLGAAGCPTPLLEELIVPGLRPLSLDPTPQIRQATTGVIAQWLAGPAPSYDPDLWAPSVLPILMLGLTDDVMELRSEALAHVERVGAAWLQRQQLRRQETPGAAAAAGTPMDVDEEGGGAQAAAELAAAQLPAPFSGPPSRAAAAMVRHFLPRVLPPALRDLREWTLGLRASAARVLQSLIVLAGAGVAPFLDTLVPALCSAMGDDEALVAALALGAVHVIGALVPVDTWLPLAMDAACGGKTTPPQRASALVVLSGLLHAAARARHPLAGAAVLQLAEALACDDVRTCDHPGVRLQLAAAVTNLVAAAGQECRVAALPLLQILLELAAREAEATTCHAAKAALTSLALACGFPSAPYFVGAQAPDLLVRLLPGHEAWTAGSGAFAALGSLLRQTSEASLRVLLPPVVPVLAALLHPDRDAAMRLELLRLIDTLLEDGDRRRAFEGLLGEQLLYMVLLPACIWRVGKVAAAVRYSAVVALGTMLRHALLPPSAVRNCLSGVQDSLPVLLQLMEEDYYADTRVAACYVMELMLRSAGTQLDGEVKRKIYPELLKRLDDSNDGCRVAVAATLRAFCDEALPTYDDTNAGYLLAGMLVHMDDANPQVQEAVFGAVGAAAGVKPAVVREEVQKVQQRHRTPIYCERVLEIAAGGAVGARPRDDREAQQGQGGGQRVEGSSMLAMGLGAAAGAE